MEFDYQVYILKTSSASHLQPIPPDINRRFFLPYAFLFALIRPAEHSIAASFTFPNGIAPIGQPSVFMLISVSEILGSSAISAYTC